MTTSFDLKYLKNELRKRANLGYFKNELNRLAGEIKKIDMNIHITPQASARLKALEERFQEILSTLHELQKQVDQEVVKLKDLIRKTREDAEARLKGFRMAGAKKKKTTRKKKTAKKTGTTRKKKSASSAS